MASIKESDSKKWINATIALGAALVGYITYAFVEQLRDWFDLEAKISQFQFVGQGVALAAGLASFFAVARNPKAMEFLGQVYSELVKVIWPDRDSVFKLTIGIIIAVGICSILLLLVDWSVQQLLNLLY